MDSIKSLDLNEWLRYFVCGAVFLATAYVAGGGECCSATVCRWMESRPAGALIAATAVIGAILYTIHRALVYPSIDAAVRDWAGMKRDPVEEDLTRWEMRGSTADGSNPGKAHSNGLLHWAAQIHLLYASGLAVLSGALYGRICNPCGGLAWGWTTLPLVVLLAIAVVAYLCARCLHLASKNRACAYRIIGGIGGVLLALASGVPVGWHSGSPSRGLQWAFVCVVPWVAGISAHCRFKRREMRAMKRFEKAQQGSASPNARCC